MAVVLIEENSIARYGQWPWPRTRLAELVERIAGYQPMAIGLDLVFPEPDRFSPGAMAAELPGLPEDLRRALEGQPTNDERFARAIRGRNVVLGLSAESQPDPRFTRAPRSQPVVMAGGPVALRRYPGHIGNVPVIDAAAAGRGALNAGAQDQVVRIVPLAIDVQGAAVPSLAVETLRVAAGAGIRLEHRGGGLLAMRFDEVRTTLQDDGQQWLRFAPHDAARAVPAAGVIAGDIDPDTLRDKIVLVGVSGLGLQDYKTTPLGEFVPGVMVHAQVAENLLAGVHLARLEAAPWIEAGALLSCGALLVLLVPRLSALRGILLALGLVALLGVAGAAAFAQLHLLFDPAWPAIGIAAVFGSVVVGTLSEAERQRRQLREQAARLAGEMDAARRIQMGLLPDPREVLGDDQRFALAALLEPARTVGGDFYDCFMLDARRLFFVAADVSGKGLPAALFMAACKSHIKAAALGQPTVGAALTRAQADIARENAEQLFVTAFAATLDVASGELELANAGHEPPFTRRRHGMPERMAARGGPPLCVVEGFEYQSERRRLEPGEWLLLVTDGATEASNARREFFGHERLRAALARAPEGATAQALVQAVREELARFAEGAEPADDITIVALRWEGGAGATSHPRG